MFPHNSYCIISFPQFILSNIIYRNKETSKLCIENGIYKKTEQSVVICTPTIFILHQKFWTIRKTWVICLLIFCKNNQHFITLLLEMRIFFLSEKFLFFSKIKSTITIDHPKGLTWHFIEAKTIKHDYYSSIIM